MVFPEAEKLFNGSWVFRASGEGMLGAAGELACGPDIELSVASVYSGIKDVVL